MKKLDAWIRWSYSVNGWMWSVMDGATVVIEGACKSQDEARQAAKIAMATA